MRPPDRFSSVAREPANAGRTSLAAWLSFAGVVAIALVIRLAGNAFGLPFLYHEDEGGIVPFALRVPTDGPNPHWFHYPSLMIYVHAVAYALVYAFERASGAATSFAAFAASAADDPTLVTIVGRSVTALFGVGSVIAVAIAARRLDSLAVRDRAAAGLAAAALLALDALSVEHAHYVTTDVPFALASVCVLIAVAPLVEASDGGSTRAFAIAGAFVGLAASIKYPGALLAVAVVVAYALRADWRDRRARLRDPRLPVAAAASIAAFLATSPYVVLAWPEFVRDFTEEAAHMRGGHLGFEGSANHWLTLGSGFVGAGGIGLLLLFVVGVVTVARRRDGLGIVAVVTALALFVSAALSNVLFTRYLVPVIPLVAVVAARGAVALAAGRRAALVLLVGAACVLPAFVDAHRLRLFRAGDTRTEARLWMEAHATGRALVEWKAMPTGPRPIEGVETARLDYDVAALVDGSVRYVVVSDRLYKRYLRTPERHAKQIAFYHALLESGPPAVIFSPYEGDAGKLVADAEGEPRIMRGSGGPQWLSLPRRRVLGPVVEIFEIGP